MKSIKPISELWLSIDMDFMNLKQFASGDCEFVFDKSSSSEVECGSKRHPKSN